MDPLCRYVLLIAYCVLATVAVGSNRGASSSDAPATRASLVDPGFPDFPDEELRLRSSHLTYSMEACSITDSVCLHFQNVYATHTSVHMTCMCVCVCVCVCF